MFKHSNVGYILLQSSNNVSFSVFVIIHNVASTYLLWCNHINIFFSYCREVPFKFLSWWLKIAKYFLQGEQSEAIYKTYINFDDSVWLSFPISCSRFLVLLIDTFTTIIVWVSDFHFVSHKRPIPLFHLISLHTKALYWRFVVKDR